MDNLLGYALLAAVGLGILLLVIRYGSRADKIVTLLEEQNKLLQKIADKN